MLVSNFRIKAFFEGACQNKSGLQKALCAFVGIAGVGKQMTTGVDTTKLGTR